MSIYIGTSGFSYKGWEANAIPSKKNFYVGKSNLKEYSTHFNVCEINSTFYKTPSVKTVQSWYKDGNNFIVKVNKYLTHAKKLSEWETLFPEFYDVISNLKEKLVGFLIQLPPQMSIKCLNKIVQAAKFCKEQYPNVDFYIEFRHSTLFCEQVYDTLRGLISIVFVNQYGVAKDMPKGFSPSLDDFEKALTVPNKVMFRNHGTWSSQAYCGSYSDEDLAMIASLTCSMTKTIVIFDNTDSFEGQLEIHLPGNKSVFSMSIQFMDTILPCAVADAKRMKNILYNFV